MLRVSYPELEKMVLSKAYYTDLGDGGIRPEGAVLAVPEKHDAVMVRLSGKEEEVFTVRRDGLVKPVENKESKENKEEEDMKKIVRIRREAQLEDNHVTMKFYVTFDGHEMCLRVSSIAVYLPYWEVDRITGNALDKRDEEVLSAKEIEELGARVEPAHNAVIIPVEQGREGVKRVTQAVIDRIKETITRLEKEARKKELKSWLWEYAEAAAPEFRLYPTTEDGTPYVKEVAAE